MNRSTLSLKSYISSLKALRLVRRTGFEPAHSMNFAEHSKALEQREIHGQK